MTSNTAGRAARRRTQEGHTRSSPTQSTLSVQRAFVVQFRETPAAARRVWQGRAEHIASGQATTFTSRAELLAFLHTCAFRRE